jgi:leucyl aminopeptidase
MDIFSRDKRKAEETVVYLADKHMDLSGLGLKDEELNYIKDFTAKDQRLIFLNRLSHWEGLLFVNRDKKGSDLIESLRLDGSEIQQWAVRNKIISIQLEDITRDRIGVFAVAEGIALKNYQFLKYFSDTGKKKHSLTGISIINGDESRVNELKSLIRAVYFTRDLINEPLSTLNAPRLADIIADLGKKTGFPVEVFDKSKIESLKMGGLLAVNRGSLDPPRFCILSHEPEKAVNKKPLVLVGKGIVYDTGGLSLKPTANSMDYMKSDMSGAAAVAGIIYALSELNWPVRVIGLIPATDNRPDGNAYVPGDIIRMHNGLFVEVMNTDAEGRMILADALSYAAKYDPELVVDLATLTGAAAVALGNIGTVAMGTAGDEVFDNLINAGEDSYERIVRFPLWDEYGKMLESENADLKNIGGRDAGAITAGKFLERFVSYPWIHLDIAGPAFINSADGYRTFGGTGTGVRLLLEFIRRKYLS